MIADFVARKPVVAPPSHDDEVSATTVYDSIKVAFSSVQDNAGIKEYFSVGPLEREGYGSASLTNNPGKAYNETKIGVNTQNVFAQLQGVSNLQVVLPPAMANTFISYCYKSVTKAEPKYVLDTLMHNFELKWETRDSLLDVLTLEVTDTVKLLKNLADPGANTSRMSGGPDVISLENHHLSAMMIPLQDPFPCLIALKNAEQFNARKFNLTIFTTDLAKLQASMAPMGIKVTRDKEMQKVYYLRNK
jgi:hypothetical protein